MSAGGRPTCTVVAVAMENQFNLLGQPNVQWPVRTPAEKVANLSLPIFLNNNKTLGNHRKIFWWAPWCPQVPNLGPLVYGVI